MAVDLTAAAGAVINTATVKRTMKSAVATEGGSFAMPDEGNDGMLSLSSAAPLQAINLALPVNGDVLQMVGLCSMQDIAAITFSGGSVLNAPTELLSNQAILLQRIDKATNKWITL